MIKGIGNDIIEINRIRKAIERPRFIEKHYSAKEIALYHSRNNNIEILAGNFAIKESVAKVFGTGVRGFSLMDIEVLRDELGKPFVVLHNEARRIAEHMRIERLIVSIAHSKTYAIGFAIGEGE